MKLRLLAAAIGLFALTACDDPATARRVLDNQGYTNVQLNGRPWFGCGKDDAFATAFSATSPSGKPVTGVVCSDLFKGATIRFD